MAHVYEREEIIHKVKKHFEDDGFKCEAYWDELGDIRLPLYCFKRSEGKIQEQIVVDFITDETISTETHMRREPVDWPKVDSPETVVEHACSLKFFQYYLPLASTFWAYGDYVSKNSDFEEFRKACNANGIGLLEVSEDGVEKVVDQATPLHEHVVDLVKQNIDVAFEELAAAVKYNAVPDQEGGTNEETGAQEVKDRLTASISELFERLEDEYIHYLVYYAYPRYQRRAIVSREDMPDISITLINSLHGIDRLEYRATLTKLAADYMYAYQDDPDIALQTIQSLWKSQLRVTYPSVHKPFESVLLLNRRYRDHFVHQFQVFLLGALIIDRLYDTEPVVAFNRQCDCKLERAWLAASTYHDFNYMIQDFESWMSGFLRQTLHVTKEKADPWPLEFDVEKVVVRDEFLRKMDGLFKAIGCEKTDDCELRFILGRVAADKDHAAIGALTFLNKFKGHGRLKALAANHAAASILLHEEKNWQCFCGETTLPGYRNWEREFLGRKRLPQLRFDTLPLAFLLAFCDNVQEWGRIGRDYASAEARLEQIEVDDQKILVGISLADAPACKRKWRELKRLGNYLADERFGIRIRSHMGSFDETVWMVGKPN